MCSVFSKNYANSRPRAGSIDTARIDLASLRKGLKLRRHADERIKGAIESAKLGVGRVLGVIVGDIFRDPMEQMDAIDRDMQKDAKAVRRELLSLSAELRGLISEETRQLITLGRQAYAEGLERLEATRQMARGQGKLPP